MWRKTCLRSRPITAIITSGTSCVSCRTLPIRNQLSWRKGVGSPEVCSSYGHFMRPFMAFDGLSWLTCCWLHLLHFWFPHGMCRKVHHGTSLRTLFLPNWGRNWKWMPLDPLAIPKRMTKRSYLKLLQMVARFQLKICCPAAFEQAVQSLHVITTCVKYRLC